MSDERSANANDRRLGQRVRIRRLEINMSQERLAELLGVTFQQVQKYEKGVNRIAASRLFDIACALETPVADFFKGFTQSTLPQPPSAAIDDSQATVESVELNRIFAALKSPMVRRRVVGLVKAIADEPANQANTTKS